MDATGLATVIRNGEISAREAVTAAIERIERANGPLNAVVNERFQEALDEVDRGLPAGPFTGVPFLIKDLGAQVAGLPATRGSRLFAGVIAGDDSPIVTRYRRAGLVILGTTNVPEFGKNASTEPALHGPTHNPWDLGYSPGGSSGGSAAAVAAGLVPAAHATDGGGSIRIPAAMCGLFGLKPTRGRTPSGRGDALAEPLSVQHALTVSVRDSAALLDAAAISASSVGDLERPAPSLRIGVTTTARGGGGVDPAFVGAVNRVAAVCDKLGHRVTPATLSYDSAAAQRASSVLMCGSLAATVETRLLQLGRELREDDLEPLTRLLFEQGRGYRGVQVIEALRALDVTRYQVAEDFEEFDLLLTPTVAALTPTLGTLDTSRPEQMMAHVTAYTAFTNIFNVSGQPAMSIPAGVHEGLPIGVQFAARLGEESALLQLAADLEKAMPWAQRAPAYRS